MDNIYISAAARRRRGGMVSGEFVFFALLALSVFLKFYSLEYEVSGRFARHAFSLAASVSASVFFPALVSLFWRKGRLPLALLLDFALTALVVTDVLHVRYYSDLFTFRNLGLSSQLGDVSDSVFALFAPSDIFYFADIPLLCLFCFFCSKLSGAPFFRKLTARRAALTLLLCAAAASVFAFRIISYDRMIPGVLRSMWDRPAVCNNVGAAVYHAADAWNTFADAAGRRRLDGGEAESALDWYAGNIKARRAGGAAYGVARGKNLIIVQAESLQSFVLGLKLNGKYVTPNLNEFAARASFRADAYNQTSSGNSSDAEFIVNTGFYPAASGVAYTRFAGNTYRALPHVLREAGYVSLAMHGDRASFWNRAHMYPALGFGRFVSKKDYAVDEVIGLGLSDKSFFRQSLAMLEREQQPFYAFLVTLSSHYPFNFPELLKQAAFNQGDEIDDMILRSYVAAMHYFDREFGAFLEGLKRSGLYDESVIILYGDHTAIPRWDSPALSKLLGVDLSKDHNWRAVCTVPLIINVPGRARLSAKAGAALGVSGVAATAASLLGVDFDAGFGADIFSEKVANMPVIFRNGSYMSGCVFVEPQAGSAMDVRTGVAVDYEKYSEMSGIVSKTLEVNDKILEYDLLAKKGR